MRFKLSEYLRPSSSVLDVNIEHDEPRWQVDTYAGSALKQVLGKFSGPEWCRALPSRRSRTSIRAYGKRAEALRGQKVSQGPRVSRSNWCPTHVCTKWGLPPI